MSEKATLKQGPETVYELLFNPIVQIVAIGLTLVFVAGGLYVFHRDGLREEMVSDVFSNGLLVGTIYFATDSWVRVAGQSYVVDVVAGFLTGLLAHQLIWRAGVFQALAAQLAKDFGPERGDA